MRDGRRQQIAWSYAVLHDAWERVAYVVGAGLDISAQLRAQQESQASAVRVQAILDTAIDGILSLDEAGRIEACNPAAEQLFGYHADEMIGQPLARYISSPAHDAHTGGLMHAIRTGEKQLFGSTGDVMGKHQDGTTFPIELAVGDMHLNGQRLFTVIVRDLTERRQIEEKMRHTDRLALVGRLTLLANS
jgi:two-component system sensor kinase FixL